VNWNWKEAGVRGGSGGVGRIRLNVGNGVTFTYDQARSILARFGFPWEDDSGQHTTLDGAMLLYRAALAIDLLSPTTPDELVQRLFDDSTFFESFSAFDAACRLGAATTTKKDRAALRQMLQVVEPLKTKP
jgi:hypothetical protein